MVQVIVENSEHTAGSETPQKTHSNDRDTDLMQQLRKTEISSGNQSKQKGRRVQIIRSNAFQFLKVLFHVMLLRDSTICLAFGNSLLSHSVHCLERLWKVPILGTAHLVPLAGRSTSGLV